MTSIRLLTRRQVEQACGLSRSTIYRKMREGTFPEPIRIGVRAVRWPAHELEDWLASLPRQPATMTRLRRPARTAPAVNEAPAQTREKIDETDPHHKHLGLGRFSPRTDSRGGLRWGPDLSPRDVSPACWTVVVGVRRLWVVVGGVARIRRVRCSRGPSGAAGDCRTLRSSRRSRWRARRGSSIFWC